MLGVSGRWGSGKTWESGLASTSFNWSERSSTQLNDAGSAGQGQGEEIKARLGEAWCSAGRGEDGGRVRKPPLPLI